MTPTNFIVEHHLDDETIEQLNTVRDIRLALARKQLAEIDNTMAELISRNLITADDIAEMRQELEQELLEKIAHLEERQGSEHVYFDELSLYVDLI